MRSSALYVDSCAWGNDWRAFVSWVGRVSTGRQDEKYTPEQELKHVDRMYRQRHLSVFEHWPITLYVPTSRIRYLQTWLIQRQSPTVFSLDPMTGEWRTNIAALFGLRGANFALPSGFFPGDDVNRPGAPLISLDHHHSGASEHTLATFVVHCSRACADQHRTYRVMHSYVMESQRRVRPSDAVTSQSQECLAFGIDLAKTTCQENERLNYPMGAMTTLIHTATLGAWKNFLEQRFLGQTGKPSDEIKQTATQIRDSLIKAHGKNWANF